MLAYLVIHNNSIASICMKTISDKKCQLRQFHTEQCFIKKRQEKIDDICVIMNAPLIKLIYLLGK